MHTAALLLRIFGLLMVGGLAIACGESVAASSACRNLVYDGDQGVARKEYLPCAGEMMAVLDELDAQTAAAFKGDSGARAEGQASLRKVKGLMQAAGGRKLLDRWRDRALMDLNVDINNAVTHYQAFYMVRIIDEPDSRAALTRQAAEAELNGAQRRYNEARGSYRGLR
jgi:hypothetical protein